MKRKIIGVTVGTTINPQTVVESTEVADIRVGYDGTVYPTVGEAVREQARKLSEEIDTTNGQVGKLSEEIDTTNGQVGKLSEEIDTTNEQASMLEKRIVNLEQGIIPSPFITDDTAAYRKDVPENALPYAEVSKIGGMTRRCTNLCTPLSVSGGALNELTFVTSPDGTLTVNGTASKDLNIITAFENALPPGDYYVTLNNNIAFSNVTAWCRDASGALYGSHKLSKINMGVVFSCTTPITQLRMSFPAGVEFVDFKVRPQINVGTEALPYEPHFEGLRSAPITTVESVGVNLGGLPYEQSSSNLYGVKWEVNANGGVTGSGTPTGASFITIKRYLNRVFANDILYFGLHGTYSNMRIFINIYDASATRLAALYPNSNQEGVDFSQYPTMDYFVVGITRTTNAQEVSGTAYPTMSFVPLSEYKPYFRNTFEIPEAVQALNGYGEGNPDNANEYNSILWDDDGRCIYSHKGHIVNGAWVALDAEERIDISDILSLDNFIGVEGDGTITMANEYEYDVPSEVTYQIKEVAV